MVVPGFQRSKEALSNIAIELSRRGNVVALIDPYAQGMSSSSLSRRAATTEVSYNISTLGTDTEVIKFQPGLVGNGNANNINYVFSIPEEVTGTVTNGESNGVLKVYQGQYLTENFVIDDSQPNQRFVLPNDGIDTSTIIVKVKENSSSTTTPPPPAITKPSLSLSNGREAVLGSSFLVDNACMPLNPPIPAMVTAASEPPETIISA